VSVAALGALPLALPAFVIVYLVHNGAYRHDGNFYDLHTMWEAGRNIAHGQSPYPFIYPAPAAVIMVPFGVLPWRVAVAAFFIVCIAAVFASLRILGVRDWRCYGACLIALPTASAIWIGTPTPLLMLATACAWRWRDRRWVVALALTAAVATKIFLWPLFVWLLATRRFSAALAGLAAVVGAVVAAWGVIGFAGIFSYPRQLIDAASAYGDKSYSIVSMLHAFGITGRLAPAVAAGVAALALLVVVLLARRTGGDAASFAAAIAASLLISPIVWVHYLLLLFVPIAIVHRRLSVLWLLPLALWPLGGQESHGSIPRLLFVLGVLLIWLVAIVRAAAGRRLLPVGTDMAEDADSDAGGKRLLAPVST
jgi:glycosyl transferase family 87